MGNHNSSHHSSYKPRKNVHWKSAGRPEAPGRPEVEPLISDNEPNAICLRWEAKHDGGTTLLGYQVECNRLGTGTWVRTEPPIVVRPELVLSGLEPLHRYQFRVAAVNRVGCSNYSDISDVITLESNRPFLDPPLFLQHLNDVTVLENNKSEFKVTFKGNPTPNISWFKDGYEIFSSRRTVITTNENESALIFYQTLFTDEGEIKCTATNRAGHAVTKAHLCLESPPKLRYPRQYEDGLLYEINETVFLKISIISKPLPQIEWRHNGSVIYPNERITISNTPKFSILKIHSAIRNDRGEYQIHAVNTIGEDTTSFLVTITAPPEPPKRVSVTRQVDKSVTLIWDPPDDDGGCQIGNYIVEYFRVGWNVWLKASTTRKTSATLFDLIEGSEYIFRVKAENPFGLSAPSAESSSVKIPGRAVDVDCLAIEARVISDALLREDGDSTPVTPTQRKKKCIPETEPYIRIPESFKNFADEKSYSNDLLPVSHIKTNQITCKEKRKSLEFDFDDWSSPPELSLSAPNISEMSDYSEKTIRCAVSSTELLNERAMARFYKFMALKDNEIPIKTIGSSKPYEKTNHENTNVILTTSNDDKTTSKLSTDSISKSLETDVAHKRMLIENSIAKKSLPWVSTSFEEDYTASTVTSDEEFSDKEIYEKEAVDIKSAEQELALQCNKKMVTELLLSEPNNNYVSDFKPKSILKDKQNNVKNKKENLETSSQIKSKTYKILPSFKKKDKNKVVNKKVEAETKNTMEQNQIDFKLNTTPHKPETDKNDIIADGGKTIIDYYSNIVKEYGGHKKISPLYLNTDELKSVAEKQEKRIKLHQPRKIQSQNNKKALSLESAPNSKLQSPKSTKKTDLTPDINATNAPKLQITLHKPEKAVLIPIDVAELEEKAKKNVRNLIDYSVDFCLLFLAFWVYICKDERLAIPFLILIIYRQLQETLLLNVPTRVKQYVQKLTKKYV